MTDTVISTSQTYSGNTNAYSTVMNGDTVTILPGVYAYGAGPSYSSNGSYDGLFQLLSASTMFNYGSLIGSSTDMDGGTVFINAYQKIVTLNNQGLISSNNTGPYGSAIIVHEGQTTITNTGQITSTNFGVLNDSSSSVTIYNSGVIQSAGPAIVSTYQGATLLYNDGQISGDVQPASAERERSADRPGRMDAARAAIDRRRGRL